MRVCPECGFSDNPLWENCRFKRDLQLMRLADFKTEYPHLAEKIEKEKYVRDGQFLYHKTRLYVLRKEPADWNQPFWEQFEAHKSNRNRNLARMGNRRQRELHTQIELFVSQKTQWRREMNREEEWRYYAQTGRRKCFACSKPALHNSNFCEEHI